MAARTDFSADDARRVGAEIGIDWDSAPFDLEQFRKGMEVELEHGLHDQATNVTSDDPVVTGKIALAHLNEFPDYYTRLETTFWSGAVRRTSSRRAASSIFALSACRLMSSASVCCKSSPVLPSSSIGTPEIATAVRNLS